MKIFNISWESTRKLILQGTSFAFLTFAIAYLSQLDPVNLFANLTAVVQIAALKFAVNASWAALVAATLPFLGRLLHPTKA